LDDILFEGATLDEAAKKVDVKVGRVRGHLKHLQNDKGLTLVETGDTVKIKEATV
jgi:predicted ArsR family transcriptional regulator